MAERLVSPGVFTQEKDLSFLPQGIAEIGAAIIGPFDKGPAFVPTIVSSQNEALAEFGGSANFYTPLTVQNYLKNAGQVTIVRVLGEGGYTTNLKPLIVSGSNTILAVLAPTVQNPTYDFSTLAVTGTIATVTSTISGTAATFSLDPTQTNYITNVLGTDPLGTTRAYVYANFKKFQSGSATTDVVESGSTSNVTFNGYTPGETPFVISQDLGGTNFDLFKVFTKSDGTTANREIKVGIFDVKLAAEVPGSSFGSFGMVVRLFGDSDKRQTVLETYSNLTLDPNSVNFLPRVIGDRYPEFVTVDGTTKLVYRGDWPSKSQYIRVTMSDTFDTAPDTAVPFGFKPYRAPFDSASFPTMSLKVSQSLDNETNTKAFFGVDFDSGDATAYLVPLPTVTSTGSNANFNLGDHVGATTGSLVNRKIMLAFQNGFDGLDPTVVKNKQASIANTNTFGFDCSSTAASGTVSYRKAIDTISNPDEFDINLLVLPGIIHSLHPTVTNYAITTVEDRGDAFFIMDSSQLTDGVQTAADTVETLDTNYAGTYYPWIKILDPNNNVPLWVPPSVLLPSVYAFNDQVAQEWFAPAGLNRGGLTEAVEAYTRLTHAERDTLYEGRVNPIATFPGQGVVAWGQKTLQAKPSALDRINVRRLLIALKKFIASTSRFLVFEQNLASTRNRFLNIVNPFLESVQQRSGLFAFKVVMDESNNPPDVIDRNQLVGQIFLQPARAAEFIVLDFNILPTGASFPE
jgi:hypothetical protein